MVQFVAFLGKFRAAGSLDPWLAGTLAAMLTTWVTSAVVGVIANLGLFFAISTCFEQSETRSGGAFRVRIPEWSTF